MVYSYAITSNVFSFFDFCGVAGAHAHERSSEGFFFFFWYPRGSSVRVRFLRARAARSTPGRPAGVPVRPPAQTGSDASYTRSRVHTPGEVATPTSTHHTSNRIATRFRIAAPRSQPRSKRARVSQPLSNRIIRRARSTNRSLTKLVSNRILL